MSARESAQRATDAATARRSPLTCSSPSLRRARPRASRAAGWSADEELQLLEGIEIYGLGNWHEIASYLGGAKTDAQCSRQ